MKVFGKINTEPEAVASRPAGTIAGARFGSLFP